MSKNMDVFNEVTAMKDNNLPISKQLLCEQGLALNHTIVCQINNGEEINNFKTNSNFLGSFLSSISSLSQSFTKQEQITNHYDEKLSIQTYGHQSISENEEEIFTISEDVESFYKIYHNGCDKAGIQKQDNYQCKKYGDLWIPSHQTQQILLRKMSGAMITEQFIVPEIFEEEVIDKTVNLKNTSGVLRFSENKVNELCVLQNEYGLVELIQGENYRAAVNLTSQLLTNHRQGLEKCGKPITHTEHSIQLWFIRLALLVKLQEFRKADLEASQWWDCDRPDFYFQFYPEIYKNREGTMIPFQMRILLANIPSYCGRHTESLQRHFSILSVVNKIIDKLNKIGNIRNQTEISVNNFPESIKQWNTRKKMVLSSVINIALELKDFELAIEVLNQIISSENNLEKKKILYSTLGRIYLQFGDISNAEKYFSIAQNHSLEKGNYSLIDILDLGLLAIAQNNFQLGYKYFENASFIDPSSILVMNNCGICLFYMGYVKEATRLLHGAIINNPSCALNNSLILNLCTMYELESSYDDKKKEELINLIKKYKNNSVHISALRLH